MKVNRQSLALLIIGFAIGVVVTVVGMTLRNQTRPAAIIIQPATINRSVEETPTPVPARVHISGAVVAEGVYTLEVGDIVQDVVTAAGGFSAEARTDLVNLAQPLVDGMQIHVPADGETTRAQSVPVFTAPTASETSAGATAGTPVNINTATVGELDTLPGIGPSTAQKIVDYRDENGPFTSVEAILNVSGIGEAKFDQMAPYITIGP
jgi:competence protein ComEA